MQIDKREFIKNNIYVFSNKILSKAITFILMVFLTRSLTEVDFGNLTILITLSTTFAFLSDFGSNFFLVRETAANRDEIRKIFNITFTFKLISVIISYLLLIFVNVLLGYSSYIVQYAYIFGVGMIFQSLLQTIIRHFEGAEEMKVSSIIIISERVIIFIVIIGLSNLVPLIDSYAYAYIFSNFIILVLGLFLVWKKFKIEIVVNIKKLLNYLTKIKVLAIFAIFSAIYPKLDIFFISTLLDEISVANFRANYQLIEVLYFIPLNLAVTFLPFFSRLIKSGEENLITIYVKIAKQFLYLGLFLSITLFLNSEIIIFTLYGKYHDHSYILAYLALTLPIYFWGVLNGNILIAYKNEKIVARAVALATLIKVVVSLILISKFSMLGVIIAFVIGELAAFLYQYIYVRKKGFLLKLTSEDINRIIILIIYGILLSLSLPILYIIIIVLLFGLYISRDILKLIKTTLTKNNV